MKNCEVDGVCGDYGGPLVDRRMKHAFIIPGKPVPQERPYVTRTFTRDRPRSKNAKAYVWAIAVAARTESGAGVSRRPFRVSLNFCNANPNADLDNLCKLVLDGMKGVFWEDDRQVTQLMAFKVKDAHYTRTDVIVEELE